jgi:hypothetical protein
MSNDYFDLEKIMSPTSQKVDDELDRLNNEVWRITEGTASVMLQPISEDEARIFFDGDEQDESYYILLKYQNPKTNSTVHNKFAAISYTEFYPAYVKPLKLETCDVVKCNNEKDLRKIIRKMVNDDTVIRSVRNVLRILEDKKDKK